MLKTKQCFNNTQFGKKCRLRFAIKPSEMRSYRSTVFAFRNEFGSVTYAETLSLKGLQYEIESQALEMAA